MAERTYQVDGMACDGCEQNVIDELSMIEGVSDIDADHASDRVAVTVDDAVEDETIIGAIEVAGYDVRG